MEGDKEIEQGGLEHRETVSSAQDTTPGEQLCAWKTIKKCPRAVLSCVVMLLSPFVFGFDNIIISLMTAMPAFQSNFGDSSGVIPALWLSLWTSMVAVGVMIGAMAAGRVSERWGCRISVSVGASIAVAGTMTCTFSDELNALSSRRVLFLFGKMIIGSGLGLMLPASQTYISEVAPVALKEPLLSAYTLSMAIGQIVAVAGLNCRISMSGRMAYRLLFAIEAIPTGVAALLPFLVPESPNYHVKQGHLTRAIKSYSSLYSDAHSGSSINRLAQALEHERNIQASSETPSFQECIQQTNWRRTRIVLYANMLQSFIGIAMIQNATYFLELGGMSARNALNVTTASLCLLIPAILGSWCLMGRLGRRTILLWASTVIMLFWLAIGISGCFESTAAFWFVGCAIVATNFVYGLGVGGVYPVVAAETSSLRLRAKTQALGFATQFIVSWAFQYAIPYMYSTAEGNLGGKVGFVFAGLSAVALLVIFLEIPEMKGLRIEELDDLFEQRVATRAFGHMADNQGDL
ncbi:general substrate transporter [Aspergillus similis]